MPRPQRSSSAQSMSSSDVIDTEEGCHITNALQEHALVLHQMLMAQGVIDSFDPRTLEPLTSPGEVSETCPPVPPLRNNSRLAHLLVPTFIENPDHVNAVTSQYGESVEE